MFERTDGHIDIELCTVLDTTAKIVKLLEQRYQDLSTEWLNENVISVPCGVSE